MDLSVKRSVVSFQAIDRSLNVAAMRADSFLEAGDMAGSAVWRRVLKAIKEIWREERREGEAVN